MQVKMITLECGPAGNFSPGDIRTVSEEHGKALLAGRHAVDVTPYENAVIVPRETAVAAQNEQAIAAPIEYRKRKK